MVAQSNVSCFLSLKIFKFSNQYYGKIVYGMLGSQPMLLKQNGQQRFAFTLHTSEKSSDYSLKST